MEIEVVGYDIALPVATCWAEAAPGVLCPQPAAWQVRNLDNAGYSRLCDGHRAAFAAAEPEAAVAYVPLAGEDSDG
jgi:hypothetical protein